MATHVTKSLTLSRGRRIRLTQLDSCGRPVIGQYSQVVSSGFISVALTANSTSTDEINVVNAAGEQCVFEASVTSLTGYTLEITFCNVDPELFALATGQTSVIGSDGSTVIGLDINTGVNPANANFALELWAGSPTGDSCANPNAQGSYGYILLPFLSGGIVSDFTVENSNVTFTLSGATTKSGSRWGVGPYADIMLGGGTSEVQSLAISGVPTGGTFTLTYSGQTTAPIAYNATASAVQSALSSLSNVGAANITTSGGPLPTTPVVINFVNGLGFTDVSIITATGSFTGGTSPTATVTVTTPGVTATPGAMYSPVSTTNALRTILTDVTPPTAYTGLRPLLSSSAVTLTSVAGAKTGNSVAFTTTPAATTPVYYDFGDGTWDYVAAPGTTTHLYNPGSYTARVQQNGKWVTTAITIP